MAQGDDPFDTGIALEDSDGFLGGGNHSERLRDSDSFLGGSNHSERLMGCGQKHGLELGFEWELNREAMEGGVRKWVRVRALNLGEESGR